MGSMFEIIGRIGDILLGLIMAVYGYYYSPSEHVKMKRLWGLFPWWIIKIFLIMLGVLMISVGIIGFYEILFK